MSTIVHAVVLRAEDKRYISLGSLVERFVIPSTEMANVTTTASSTIPTLGSSLATMIDRRALGIDLLQTFLGLM